MLLLSASCCGADLSDGEAGGGHAAPTLQPPSTGWGATFWVALSDTAQLGDAEQDPCPVLGLAPAAPQPLAEASRVCCGETRCWGSRGSLCLLRGPRGSCILRSREWEAKEEAESDLKEPSGIYLPARAVRGCWGASSAAAAVWMAFAAFKSKGGEKQINGNLFCLKKNPLDLVMP